MMTVAEVREKLPDVKVLVKGRQVAGVVTGRALDFARIYVTDPSFGPFLAGEWAWSTVTRAVNENLPLRV
jgi:hypothetical protein